MVLNGISTIWVLNFFYSVGCAKGVELSIPVDPTARPIFYKPRTVPLAYREKVDAELERQIREGLLVPVKWNDWATPIVTCQKA